MITDAKEIAKRLQIEADYWRDYDEEDTIFNISNYHLLKVCSRLSVWTTWTYTQICMFMNCLTSWRISLIHNRVKAF